MKPSRFSFLLWVLAAGLGLSSCKNKSKETTTTPSTVDTPITRTPVEVSPDAALSQGVQDAIKDYPGVSARVDDGVIILEGSIERERWTKLNQTLMSLNPKRVNSEKLTVK